MHEKNNERINDYKLNQRVMLYFSKHPLNKNNITKNVMCELCLLSCCLFDETKNPFLRKPCMTIYVRRCMYVKLLCKRLDNPLKKSFTFISFFFVV